MSTTTKRRYLEAALEYAALGWRVFPLHPEDKRPRISEWQNAATSGRKQIKKWWRQWPTANVAILCDSVRGPIVLDVDTPKAGQLNGDDLLKLLKLPTPTCVVRTGSGGKHLFYAPPKSGKSIPRVIRVRHENKRYALDVLGNGGYVVAPPSKHPDGGCYQLHRGDFSDLPSLPGVIVRLIASQDGTNTVAEPLPEVISEGERDTILTSLAGTMRRRGASPKAILEALRVENASRVRPALSDAQLRKIALSIGKKPPVPIELREPITDVSLAARFAAIQRDELRYCAQWQQWLVWTGHYWKRDDGHEVDRRVEAMVREYLAHLAELPNPDRELLDERLKEIRRYLYHHKLTDVRLHARTQRAFAVTPEQLDADPWLFNVANGTLDLRTGKLRAHDPKDMLSKLAPVQHDADAKCERWRRFLLEVMGGDADRVKYLRRAVGYTMAGETPEHVLFFCHGGGANGKSTFLEVLGALFGDYAVTIDFRALLRSHEGRESRDKPRLHKARFVSANETPVGAKWDEAVVKDLTGGDTLQARWLYKETFQFKPTHTLWCRGNSQPAVHDPSDAFWRRMKLIPFTQQFTGKRRDDALKDRLLEELPGILNWALRGCMAWQRDRKRGTVDSLATPKSVQLATADYRAAEDVVGEFVAARCRKKDSAWTKTTSLYAAFDEWWHDTRGARSTAPAMRAFVEGLRIQAGVTPVRKREGSKKERGWAGLTLRHR